MSDSLCSTSPTYNDCVWKLDWTNSIVKCSWNTSSNEYFVENTDSWRSGTRVYFYR